MQRHEKGTRKRHNCTWAEKTIELKIHCDVACPFKSAGLDNINVNLKMFSKCSLSLITNVPISSLDLNVHNALELLGLLC